MGRDDSTPTRTGTDEALIDRREYLRLSGGLAAAGTVGLAGCSGQLPGGDGAGDDGGDGSDGGPTATGHLATQVTDQPTDIGDFQSCVVSIDGVWLGPRTGGEDGGSDGGDDGSDDVDGEDDEETDDANEDDAVPDDEPDDADDDDGNGTSTDGGNATSAALASGSQPEDAGEGGPGNETGGGDGGDGGDDDGDGEEASDDGDDEDGDDGEAGDDNGRQYLAFDEPQQADLVDLQGDQTQLVDEREVTVGTYQFLQLDVAGVEGTLNDGSEARVETPGQAPLKFDTSFEVREGHQTTFTADFAPVKRGNGSYLIKPVATGTEVSYVPVEGDDGGESDGDSGKNETSSDDDSGGNETGTDDGSSGGNETSTDDGSSGGNETTSDGNATSSGD